MPVGSVGPPGWRDAAFAALERRLDAVTASGGTVSVWLGDLRGVARYERLARAGHYAASTMKLPLDLAAQRQIERAELDPHRAVLVHNRFASVADGSPFSLDELDDQDPGTWAAMGATRTVTELAEHCITWSGNLATNLLLELVGPDEVAAVLADASCSPTTVVGRGIEDAAARRAGITNTVTAADLGVLLAAVGRRAAALGGETVCAPVEAALGRQRHVDQIPAGLPAGTPTANKSGWVTGVSHDACLVRHPGREPFVLVVCTTIELGETDAAALVAWVAAQVWAAETGDRQAASGVREPSP